MRKLEIIEDSRDNFNKQYFPLQRFHIDQML